MMDKEKIKKNIIFTCPKEIFGLPKEFYEKMCFKYGACGVVMALLIASINKNGKKRENDESIESKKI